MCSMCWKIQALWWIMQENFKCILVRDHQFNNLLPQVETVAIKSSYNSPCRTGLVRVSIVTPAELFAVITRVNRPLVGTSRGRPLNVNVPWEPTECRPKLEKGIGTPVSTPQVPVDRSKNNDSNNNNAEMYIGEGSPIHQPFATGWNCCLIQVEYDKS